MDMNEFAKANLERCQSQQGFNHKLADWSLSDWFTALIGEIGEAANIAKKLNRVRDGIPGNDCDEQALREKLASELADSYIYLDLLAQSAGINLSEAVQRAFNAKSAKIGYPVQLNLV